MNTLKCWGLPWWLSGKESAASVGDHKRSVWSLGWEDPLEEEMATWYSILVGIIPWTEEPGGLQSMGLQRVGHNWAHSSGDVSLLHFTHCLPANNVNLSFWLFFFVCLFLGCCCSITDDINCYYLVSIESTRFFYYEVNN